MNWFKKLFGIGDKMETGYNGLPKVSCNIPMPEVKPCKPEKNISEPVHGIVKNMLEHPQRWKVKSEHTYSGHVHVSTHTVTDTKTSEVFTSTKSNWFIGGIYEDEPQVSNLLWATKDEIDLLKETLGTIHNLKWKRVLRLSEHKKSKERLRLLEIYK